MNTKKNLVTGFLIFCFIAATTNAEFSEIRIDSVTWDPSYIEAGDDVTVYVKFHNHPLGMAYLTPAPNTQPDEKDAGVFYTARLEPMDELSEKNIIIKKDTKNVGHLFIGESWTTPFDIKIRENAVATTYNLKFSIIKTDIDGTQKDTDKFLEFKIPVKGVVKFKVDSDNTLKLGDTGDIQITISNEGGGNAKYVTGKLGLSDPFTPAKTSEIYVGDFMGDESKDLIFSVSVNSGAEPKAYTIPLQITYTCADGTEKQMNTDIGVQIDATPKLRIALENADMFTQGSSGTVSVDVVNEGFVDAKFLTLKLLPDDNYKILSIGEIYIGNLDSDDSESEEYLIQLSENVPNGAVPLKFELRYKTANRDIEFLEDADVTLNVLTSAEYADGQPKQNLTSQIFGALFIIPILVIVYLLIWIVFKLVGLFTGYLNKRFFGRR